MGFEVGGIFGLILLICIIWAGINVINSRTTSMFGKVIWIVALLMLPVIGFLAWLFIGPRASV